MHGTTQDFEDIQWKGAANVATAARDTGAKLVHFSAIGANSDSPIPYAKTKGLGETAVFETYPTATIVRPSLVFGPNDDFFNVTRSPLPPALGLILRDRDLLVSPSSYLFCQFSAAVDRCFNQSS